MINSTDCHIHLQIEKADDLLAAMAETNTTKVILLGSSRFTFTLNPADGFTEYHKNNMDLLQLRKKHPGRFEVWPTIDPLALGNVDLLKYYASEGAAGLKLYVGHGYAFGSPPKFMFHTTAIDGKELMGVYEFCEKNGFPICLHVNTTDNAPGFRDEFENVLNTFTRLKVLAPHWMLATKRPKYLRKMLELFPNLSTDTSFGQDDFFDAGMSRIAKNKKTFTNLIMDFPDRVLCGSDIVCTIAPHKSVYWISSRISAYKMMLAEESFICPVTMTRREGLKLPDHILFKLLKENAANLLPQ